MLDWTPLVLLSPAPPVLASLTKSLCFVTKLKSILGHDKTIDGDPLQNTQVEQYKL